MISPIHPIRLLVIDDDENDFFIISDLVQGIAGRKFIIDWAYTYEDALEQIHAGQHDLYFVDYLLGKKTGLDLLREVSGRIYDQPIVLLTGIDNRELDIKAMFHGAVDYLVKSELNTEKLERCIRYSLDRYNSVKALKANEHKFHSIFEKSKDAIFLADEHLVFKEVNNAASELFKYEREELLRTNLYALFPNPNAASGLKAQLEEMGKVENMEAELVTKTREKKSFILSLSIETDADNSRYVQGIIRDITNLKKMEKAALQIEKLKDSEKLLRTLAHEVRNPLTTINLSLDHLKTELAGSEGEAFAEIIDRNLKRIDSLVTELLNSTRQGDISPVNISLQQILQKTIEAATDRIALKHIRLHTVYPERPVLLMADEAKLKIAFLNIIVNAIEAMPAETGRLTINVKESLAGYTVMISDNGSGIPEENISRIFDPYYTSKPNGFGLGLATTMYILKLHGASVDVQSEPGTGTIFVISFNRFGNEDLGVGGHDVAVKLQ